MLNVNKNTIILSVAALVLLSIDVSFAHTTYGSQLMSPKERAEHRAKMMSLPPSEREAYRTEHHKVMMKLPYDTYHRFIASYIPNIKNNLKS